MEKDELLYFWVVEDNFCVYCFYMCNGFYFDGVLYMEFFLGEMLIEVCFVCF